MRLGGGHFDEQIAKIVHARGAAAGQAEGGQPERPRHAQRLHDVGRVAGGADAQQHVARASEHVHLLGERQVARRVIADGAGQRRVAREGNRRDAALEFGGERVGVVGREGCAVTGSP